MMAFLATAVSKSVSCTSRGKSGHSASAALPNRRSNSWVELFIITGPALFNAQLRSVQRPACDIHAPFCWESEPPLTFAHTPLPRSSSARLIPSIWVNCKTPCWTHNHHETSAPRQAGGSASIAVIRLPVNELSMNFASHRVDHGYLQVLVVPEALVAEVPDNFTAVRDRFRLCSKLGPDDIPMRDAIFHIEEELLHRITSADQSGVPAFVPGAVTPRQDNSRPGGYLANPPIPGSPPPLICHVPVPGQTDAPLQTSQTVDDSRMRRGV